MERKLYMKYFVIKMDQAIDLTKLLVELEEFKGQKYIIGKELADCILESMVPRR